MSSPLSFSATEQYRKALLVKNLKPYNDDGFVPTSEPGQTEFNINDQSVIDSVEVEVIGETQSDKLFIKNIYGPDGGYGFPIDIEDVFSPSLIGGVGKEPYYTFVASTYNAFSILTSNNPQGSNGSLSQDSALARIAAESLQTELEYRIAQETYQQTLGRINAIDAVSDPYELLSIVTGNRTVIERDWKISVPKDFIGKGLDFISRISGVYSPYSWIPGDYFSASPRQLLLNQAANAITGLFDKRGTLRLPTEKTGMQIFLENTGGGQRSRLFKGVSMNRYIPDYNRNLFNDNFTTVPQQNYYIGSSQREIASIVSIPSQLPIDQDGNKVQTPVRGYGDVGKEYEGNNKNFKFGLNSSSYYNDSIGIMGGFTWVSPKYKDRGGELIGEKGEPKGLTDADFGQIVGVYESSQSTNYEFTKGSILDNTQRLIDAADTLNGEDRLQHVGNAIDQVSKVFNDGYKELTKGSRVINYVNNTTGQIVGREYYCRVFTKDRPYLFMNELQKSAGMTTENRRFTYSVLDKTYNLNITPTRGEDSTNIIDGSVKKYMFSIENLAWRTSTKPGFTYQDLPHCEKGPNGGRIMWFPPYDMNVSESNRPNWTTNEFLGRPEPIYTYNNTTREGSLSWKIVVDHPSILNAIVDKELKGENNERVNAIVDSFFAGCRKYDIYELARRFPQFTFQDIYDIITTNPDPEVVRETYKEEVPVQPTEETPPLEVKERIFTDADSSYDFEFYFDHDVPGPKDKNVTVTTEDYFTTLTKYIGRKNKYTNFNSGTTNFFTSKIETISGKTTQLVKKISKALNEDHTLTITLIGSASAPGDPTYNESLSKRRIDSVKKYLLLQNDGNGNTLQKWVDDKKLIIVEDAKGEGETIQTGDGPINCTDNLDSPDNIYSINAMYCRRVRISTIIDVPPTPEEIPPADDPPVEAISGESNETEPPTNPIPQRPTTTAVRREQIAKIIVKKLLTECDYFDLLKEDSPIAYNGIKEKLKYFQPAFHAITPEGLNSRLTFLQQCIRPGDTIPVIGPDGRPTENDARNTAFGAPPICILRIGDFYHTKIAINQLTIQYEPLIFDLNPEGIGVQPMIASINMSFYFIGGQGLKEPVNRLQNALSFNYYANTEVYDDRSIKTDPSLDELNAEIWEDIQLSLDENGKPTIDVVPDSGDAIGTFIGQETFSNYSGGTASTINGQISYKDKSLLLIDNSKKYVDSVVNSFTDITKEYSFDLLYYFDKRPYSNGRVLGYYGINEILFTGSPQNLDIYGSPLSIQDKIDFLFNQALLDIDNETSPILKNIQNKSFKNRDIRRLKNNIKAYITSKKSNYANNMLNAIKNITRNELNLIRDIDELSFVLTNTDGYRLNNNKTILLDLTATTNVTNTGYTNTYEELEGDISIIGDDLQNFYNSIFVGDESLFRGKTYDTYNTLLKSPNNTPSDVIFMHIFFNEVLTDNDNLIKNLMGEDLYNNNENMRKYITDIVSKELVGQYLIVRLSGSLLLAQFEKKPSVTKFVDYSPYNNKDKERLFNYSKISASQVVNYPKQLNMFNRLRSGLNQQPSPTERNYSQIEFNGTVNFK